jgi:hypothetical protein
VPPLPLLNGILHNIRNKWRQRRQARQASPPTSSPPLPKNVGRLISKYVDRKKSNVFFMLTS